MSVEERKAGQAAADSLDRCVACGAGLDDTARCPHCGTAARAGAFRVVRVIAQTPRGRMYLAEDANGKRVALKELVFTQVPGLQALESFRREAEILRSLEHPAIPRFVASFEEGVGVNTRLYIAQEFEDGENLEARAKHHRFDEGELVTLARQILEVLVSLQRRSPRVIHRDVKPANIVARGDGKFALVDFGSARGAPGTLGATVDVGTWGYMPPEQLAGEVDDTTDVYALAATVLHLVTGGSPREILARGTLPADLPLSPGFAAWLARCVQRRPEARFAGAHEALEALRTLGSARGARGARQRVRILARAISFAVVIGTIVAAMVAFEDLPSRRVHAPAFAPVAEEGPAPAWDVDVKLHEPRELAPIDLVPGVKEEWAKKTPTELARLMRTDHRSQTADFNLLSIFDAEKRFHEKNGRWLPFKRGDAETWKSLGLTLPYPAFHVYSAQVGAKGNLILRAEGNLDGDPWLDRWHLDTEDPSIPGSPGQDSSDSIDRDLDGATQDYWPSSPER